MIVGPVGQQRTLHERQRSLMRWYRKHGRHQLPWRRHITPYGVLVSEIMLQQTQVDRVIPYWNAWMRRWPTLDALARAKRADVIRAWAGLGYNRRAVYLHALAIEVIHDSFLRKLFRSGVHPLTLPLRGGGEKKYFPTSLRERGRGGVGITAWAMFLQRLPGIGPYTANALLAFAWNLPAPCVDTNVRRILAYVIYRRPSIMRMPIRRIMEFAARVIPSDRCRDWNYALMDYGALVFRASAVPKRSRPVATQGTFKDSARFWRGRIVAVLRETSRSVTIRQLRSTLQRNGGPPHRLAPLIAALERDGVIVHRGSSYALA